MKTSNNIWLFYLVVAGAVLLNEMASAFGVQFIAFVPLMLVVLWAGFKFIPKG